MKLLLFTTILVGAAILTTAQQYTNKFDQINLDEILSNKKVLTGYTNCMLDKGRCSVDGRELKSHISEALRTGCKKCTEAQKRGTIKVIRHLIKYEKAVWLSLQKKYDPTGVYAKKYERELRGL